MFKYAVLILIVLQSLVSCGPANHQEDFEQKRLMRIKKDFTKTQQEVKAFIQRYIPDVNDAQMLEWEKSRALEMRMIDGEKKYFKRAARNLFRIDPQCREIWEKAHPQAEKNKAFKLDEHDQQVINRVKESGKKYVHPVRFRITQTLTVDANVVPAGETIRCWIPFPIEIKDRQTDIKLIASQPEVHQLSAAGSPQRIIYFEQRSVKDSVAEFWVTYEYTAHATYSAIDPALVQRIIPEDGLEEFLAERPPHIIFSDTLRELSEKIVGSEKNPYRIAQKLFTWVDSNIPWASAREYSTIKNISQYAYENLHGDCGIQTLLFITLCRLNGIPARWQSGWEFKPPHDSMHDWGMLYFKPYGWVPVDVTYGLRNSSDEQLKWFYLNGMDSYRLIFNEDFSQLFNPPKTFIRSETVDSQRGEAEWAGRNLYFDQWNWKLDWEIVSQ